MKYCLFSAQSNTPLCIVERFVWACGVVVASAIALPAYAKQQPVDAPVSQGGLPQPVTDALKRYGIPPSAISVMVQEIGLDYSAQEQAKAAQREAWESTRLQSKQGLHKGVYSTSLSLPGESTATPTPVPTLPPPTMFKPLVSHQASVPRNPASVTKLITTYAALDALGADFRWQNKVYYSGNLAAGTLYGDLIIRGSGDPKLVLERIEALFKAIQRKGVKHVKGDIILDRSVFRPIKKNPASFDGQPLRSYNATPDGLMLNFKSLIFTFDPSVKAKHTAIARKAPQVVNLPDQPVNATANTSAQQPTLVIRTPNMDAANAQDGITDSTDYRIDTSAGNASQRINLPAPNARTPQAKAAVKQAAKKSANTAPAMPAGNYMAVQFEPPISGVTITPKVKLANRKGCGNWKSMLRANFSNSRNIRFNGTYSPSCGQRAWPIAYPDADNYAPRVVDAMWKRAGGTVSGKVRYGSLPKRKRLLLSRGSLPLYSIITDINHFSNNIMADQVFLSLPVYTKNNPKVYTGSYAQSRKWVSKWWKAHLSDVPAPDYVDNGSGLSRRTRASAQSINGLLQHAAQHPQAESFVRSLPVAGESGTMASLKSRDPDSAAIGRAHIKTGTLSGVRAIGGYVNATSGKRYTVVAMMNHKFAGRGKPVLDALLDWTARQ